MQDCVFNPAFLALRTGSAWRDVPGFMRQALPKGGKPFSRQEKGMHRHFHQELHVFLFFKGKASLLCAISETVFFNGDAISQILINQSYHDYHPPMPSTNNVRNVLRSPH